MLNYGETFCRGLNATASCRWAIDKSWYLSLLCSLTWQRDLNRTDPEDEDTLQQAYLLFPDLILRPYRNRGLAHLVADRVESPCRRTHGSYADPNDVLSPYNNVDLKITGSWRGWGASLEINDLLDEQYEHIPRYPMPGRTYRFSPIFNI